MFSSTRLLVLSSEIQQNKFDPDCTTLMSGKAADTFFTDGELDKWSERASHPPEADEARLLEKWLPDDKQARILEGGTGAGRLAFHIESLGFQHIDAFDLMPELVHQASEVGRSRSSLVRFFQADLCEASSADETLGKRYDTIIYYQQVFSLVPPKDWNRTLQSVHDLMEPDGKFLVSFCQHEGRRINVPLRAMLATLRFARRERTSSYSQPLIKHGNRLNRSFFKRDQFLIHWLPRKSIERKLQDAGFRILESVTSSEVLGKPNPKLGMLYLVCEKQAT